MRHKIPHQLRKLCKSGHIVSWKTKSRCFSTSRGIKSQFKHQVKAQAARENPGISKSQGLQSEIKNQVIKAQAVRKDQSISTSQGIQLELTNQAIKVQAPKEFEDPSIRTSQDIKTDFKHQFKAQAARMDSSIRTSQDSFFGSKPNHILCKLTFFLVCLKRIFKVSIFIAKATVVFYKS